MNQFHELDPIEGSLRDLADAERAELFRRTRVDARSLLYSTPTTDRAPLVLRKTRWVSIAAVLAFAATICGWFFTTGNLMPRERRIPGGMVAIARGSCDGAFFGCLTGPNGTPETGCITYDYDADGDVDLVDARTHQLNCNGITR